MARIYPKGGANNATIDKIIQSMIDDGTMSKLADKYLAAVWGKDPAKVPVFQSVTGPDAGEPIVRSEGDGAGQRFAHTARRVPTDASALAALLFAAFCVSLRLGHDARSSARRLDHLQIDTRAGWASIFFLMIAADGSAVLAGDPRRGDFRAAPGAALAIATTSSKRASMRASARDWSYLTFGWGAAALVALGFVAFVMANDAAVGQTFFFLPLMLEKWPLVVRAFWNNIFIFVIAEILVLVWGLVVAIARLMPGPAGQPIRVLAIVYCDVFRGLPAIVTLYLVGFGLPLSGLPDLIIPPIVGLFVNFDGMTAAADQAIYPHPA